MSDTRRFASLPPLTLSSDLTETGVTLKTTANKDWNGDAITSAMFNTDYIFATLINDSRKKVEFIMIDVSTIANLTTTGVTIFKRGLPYFATGNDAADTTEDSDHKYFWTQGETKVLLGTNPPLMYGSFPSRKNDETISGLWTFALANRPKLDTDSDTTTDEDLITYGQLSRTAISGAVNADITHKGIAQMGTLAEGKAGTAIGTTGAYLFVNPADLQTILQGQESTYVVEDGAGADDDYTGTATPTISAYTTGQLLRINFTTANTGAATLDVDSVGVKDIKKYVDGAVAALETGDIVAGYIGLLEYDGTQFVLLSMTATMPTTVVMSEMTDFFNTYDKEDFSATRSLVTASGDIKDKDVVYITGNDEVEKFLVSSQAAVAAYSTGADHNISPQLYWLENGKVILFNGGSGSFANPMYGQIGTINSDETDFTWGSEQTIYSTTLFWDEIKLKVASIIEDLMSNYD